MNTSMRFTELKVREGNERVGFMYCLWNGEHGYHDLSHVGGLEDILVRQRKLYEKYVGTVIGDYTCLEVEYDWGRRDQRWKCKCNKCGDIVYQYHARDWRRGAGKRTYCIKCKVEEEKRESEEKKNELQHKIDAVVGTVYENWKIIKYAGFVNCEVECTVCGKKRKVVKIDDITNKRLAPCNHRIPNDYSDPKWEGIRIGHLVSVRKGEGDKYVLLCDCGRERTARATDFFSRKTVRDCGNKDCVYASERVREAHRCKKIGFDYEDEIVDLLARNGYNAERHGEGSDYGVDIVCVGDDGERIAIQCKSQHCVTGVDAIQQVYAGGRYFGINKFAVVARDGFSGRAVRMAHVLGVYLSDGKTFEFPKDIEDYAVNLLPVYEPNKDIGYHYELNGVKKTLADWCVEFGTTRYQVREAMKTGMSFGNALLCKKTSNVKRYTVDGFTGTINEIALKYGMNPGTIRYRVNNCGMTIEQAILTPLCTNGRRKNNLKNIKENT